MELGRKGRESIRLGPAPLGGDTEEGGDYKGGDIPGEWLEPHPGSPSPGVQQWEDECP